MKSCLKSRVFKLSTQSLEFNFNSEVDKEAIEEYLFEDLEIPYDCIQKLGIDNEYINITLDKKLHYFNEDWYVNLQRVG